jgi:DNA polymerase-3 subunit epsilon
MDALVMYDLETDGLDTGTSRIVEIAMQKEESPGRWAYLRTLVNPGRPIPAEATAVHQITDADVADAPLFATIAADVQAFIEGGILVGYASRAFDTLILDAELRRAGQPGIDLDTVPEIDLYRLWQAAEPHTLVGAVKRFCGRDHEGAHGAAADTDVLPELYEQMRATFDLVDVQQLLAMSKPDGEVDRSGKFRLDAEGRVCFAFGKHEGELARDHVDYLAWMETKDFPSDTIRVVRRILRKVAR